MTLLTHKVQFHHLKKCGGTSFNNWLGMFFHVRNQSRFKDDIQQNKEIADGLKQSVATDYARAVTILNRDLVAGHYFETRLARPETFHFTILRNGTPRLISQVSDFRREAKIRSDLKQNMVDAGSMSMSQFLSKYHDSKQFNSRFFLDNHVVRALSMPVVGRSRATTAPAKNLYQAALDSLSTTYNFVGLTDQMDASMRGVAHALGLPAPGQQKWMNNSNSQSLADEAKDCADLVEQLSYLDNQIYGEAKKLFEEKFAPASKGYDEASFESAFASAMTERLLPHTRGNFQCYSTDEANLASGIQGRTTSSWQVSSARTGLSERVVIYVPAPPNFPLEFGVWIQAVSNSINLKDVRLELDDQPVSHEVASHTGCKHLLVAKHTPKRNFLKLTMLLPPSDMETEANSKKFSGLNFDAVGWHLEGQSHRRELRQATILGKLGHLRKKLTEIVRFGSRS